MATRNRNSIYYDLEGPISSQDNAQAVCKKYVKDGGKVFPVISRYDDLLTLANKEGYEPGDTLGLIVPFLIEAGVTESDVRLVSAEAGLVPGIAEFFTELQEEECSVWIISTSYEQHAFSIAKRVGIPEEQVFCTELQLDIIRRDVGKEYLARIRNIREKIAELYRENLESGESDEAMLKLLNPFYWKELPKTRFGQITTIEVMGGRRKVRALEMALGNCYLSDAIIVVDSITDWRMAQVVEAAGGVAIAWNANWYALPWCSCGVAAVDARAVRPLFKAWREGGRSAVRKFVESAFVESAFIESASEPKDAYYHWLAGEDESFQREMLNIHKRLRTVCRGAEAAKLG